MQEAVPNAPRSDLASFFASKIVGQPGAAARIIPFIQTHRAGLNHPNRPVGVFLLLGPTGTGKTRTVEVLAEALHGDPMHYLHIDCGEFQLDHEVAKLIGAPPGYLGHKESVPMLSSQKLKATVTPGCDLSLVLFDEIEKAAPSLSQLLLGMLDKGRLTMGDGNVVQFENSLIFLTSNLGAREMMKELAPTFGFHATAQSRTEWADISSRLEAISLAAVKKRFSPEFVNRIDAVITYQPLSAESITQILDHQLDELQEHVRSRLGSNGFSIELDSTAREFLLKLGVSVEYGARELKRVVYRHLTQPLATLVAEEQIAPGCLVKVHASTGGESLEFDTRSAAPAKLRAKPAVLVVDDNESLLRFLQSVLSQEGWELAAAGSAKAAIELAKKKKFDVGLIDYMLPDMDGVALSVKLKALVPSMKFVLMTGGGQMRFSQASGFAEVPVIQKPFLVDDLLKLLRHRLPKHGKSDAASAT